MDVPAGVTQEEGQTGFLIYLPSSVLALIFSREGFSRSFPSSTVKSNFLCTNDITVLHLLGIYFIFIFCEEKSLLLGFELTSQRVKRFRGYQLNHLGDRPTIL